QSGDYIVSALSARMNTDALVGDVVADWLKHGERRKTVAFAVDVAHSVAIKTAFLEFGVRCEHLDGSTPKGERDEILARLKCGETEVISNCMVLTEGWDMPEVGCIILARPTKQMGSQPMCWATPRLVEVTDPVEAAAIQAYWRPRVAVSA